MFDWDIPNGISDKDIDISAVILNDLNDYQQTVTSVKCMADELTKTVKMFQNVVMIVLPIVWWDC